MSKSRATTGAIKRLTYTTSRPFVCRSCASTASKNGRFFASSARRKAAPPPPPPSGYTKLSTRRLISLSGPDAVHFLQGVITADIAPSAVPRSSGFYAAFLNAKGRVLYDTFIYPDIYHLLASDTGKFKDANGKAGERWIVECDANEVKNLYTHLRRYKLRAKLDLRIIEEEELGVWHSWRELADQAAEGGAKWTAHSIPSATSTENSIPVPPHEEGMITLNDPRAPGLGRRILAPGSMPPAQEIEDLEEVTLDSYRIRRYLRGVQEGQGEIQSEKALPQESNIDYMSGISYRKGCYVGQELTIRTHHTGVVRKRALPVMLYPLGSAEPKALAYDADTTVEIPPLESIMDRVTKEGRQRGLGKFLTGVGNIGLGVCRLEGVQDGGPFKIQWTLEAQDEEKIVGVKAFVPSWHLKAESK